MNKFTKKNVVHEDFVDPVFYAAISCAEAIKEFGKENVLNGTVGSLYDENNELVALDTVFDTYNSLEAQSKAKYASSFAGNRDFKKRVYEWVTQDTELNLYSRICATPGGTGAVSATFANVLDIGDTIVLPNIAWSSYWTMASMNSFDVKEYQVFDGDSFNIKSFRETCEKVMEEQGKVLALINDPCQNPTGYSMTDEEWSEVIDVVNRISQKGPFVLLNDIAYIDYSNDVAKSRDYMKNFNKIDSNVLVVVAFSTSKTLTSYGLRCGASVALAKDKEAVDEFSSLVEKSARATWSCIPNAAMDNFVVVTTEKYDQFMAEKQKYIDLVKERSDLFKAEADACGLPYYPYKEGFFVTVRLPDNDTTVKFQEALFKEKIFGVRCDKGIRMAVCSIPVAMLKGLAPKMKEILDGVTNR